MGYTYQKRNHTGSSSVSASGPLSPQTGVPNSVLLKAATRGAKGREGARRQIPEAEAEADRLSAGIAGQTPDAVRQEMGMRLGTDLSSVHFHTDAASAEKADSMGARAWTDRSDVYFNNQGFDPVIAAHELVHTAQQGQNRGSIGVRQHVAPGTKQMWPGWADAKNVLSWGASAAGNLLMKAASVPADAMLWGVANTGRVLSSYFNSGGPSATDGKENKTKRPWEMTREELKANKFNPTRNEKLEEVQKRIRQQNTPLKAYQEFAKFAGNDNGGVLTPDEEGNFSDWNIEKPDMEYLTGLLCNMARMVFDYPELKGRIGNLVEKTNSKGKGEITGMSTNLPASDDLQKTWGPSYADNKNVRVGVSDINIAPSWIKGGQARLNAEKNTTHFAAPDQTYSGNHELGHVLNGLLALLKHRGEEKAEQKTMVELFAYDKYAKVRQNSVAYTIMMKALNKVATPEQKDDFIFNKGLLNTSNSKLDVNGFTGKYGTNDEHEFFAEAFADVYMNGENARKSSIEVVKLYEEMRDELNKKAAQPASIAIPPKKAEPPKQAEPPKAAVIPAPPKQAEPPKAAAIPEPPKSEIPDAAVEAVKKPEVTNKSDGNNKKDPVLKNPQDDKLIEEQIKVEKVNKADSANKSNEIADKKAEDYTGANWLKKFIEDLKQEPEEKEDSKDKKNIWDLSEEELADNMFNPYNDDELADVQEKIGKAGDIKTAFNIFADWTGNTDAESTLKDADLKKMDLQLFQKQLKMMARMVRDFPELKGRIFALNNTSDYTKLKGITIPTYGKMRAEILRNDKENPLGKKEDNHQPNAIFSGVGQLGGFLGELSKAKDIRLYEEKKGKGIEGLNNAFIDVYAHGKDASIESIEKVKAYVKSRKKSKVITKNARTLKSNGTKRPWEITKKDFESNPYNPGQIPEVQKIQDAIDAADSLNEAYRILMTYAGKPELPKYKMNPETNEMVEWDLDKEGFDHNKFKGKLKNLVRQLYDFPVLKGRLGSFERIDTSSSDNASVSPSQDDITLKYNPKFDLATKESKEEYQYAINKPADFENNYGKKHSIAAPDYTLNHEHGHILDALLGRLGEYRQGISAERIISVALRRINLNREQMREILKPVDDSKIHIHRAIAFKNDKLLKYDLTSGYGTKDALEFFAEAFKDVYANGANARPISVEIVKVYEESLVDRLLSDKHFFDQNFAK